MAEREGFEPPMGLHPCRISSAVHSTTLPPLLVPSSSGKEYLTAPIQLRKSFANMLNSNDIFSSRLPS